MRKIIVLFLVFSLVSCNSKPTEKKEKVVEKNSQEIVSKEKIEDVPTHRKKTPLNFKSETVKVISVVEELIMPADYLTHVMTVANGKNDTLFFLDAYDFKTQVGDSIKIDYELKENKRLLLCFNCTVYEDNVDLYDITASAAKPEFISLKLVRYEEDNWIIPASEFIMIDSSGQESTFFSNNNNLINDSLLMKSDFYSYGYSKISTPQLINRDELLKNTK